jgi:hypothetical protein
MMETAVYPLRIPVPPMTCGENQWVSRYGYLRVRIWVKSHVPGGYPCQCLPKLPNCSYFPSIHPVHIHSQSAQCHHFFLSLEFWIDKSSSSSFSQSIFNFSNHHWTTMLPAIVPITCYNFLSTIHQSYQFSSHLCNN